VISKDGREQAAITRGSINGLGHNTYGFIPDGTIISGGSGGFLTAYNTKGVFIDCASGNNYIEVSVEMNTWSGMFAFNTCYDIMTGVTLCVSGGIIGAIIKH
jgi:hypothetical protein